MPYQAKSKSDMEYTKQQILLIQESYKVFVPILAAVAVLLAVIDITNAVYDYLPSYINGCINVVGIAYAVYVFIKLVRSNARQQNLFELLQAGRALPEGQGVAAQVVCGGEHLRGATVVTLYENEESYTVTAKLPEYRHKLFTRYDFRNDFGLRDLPKSDYAATVEDGVLTLCSENESFAFRFERCEPAAETALPEENTEAAAETVLHEDNAETATQDEQL